MPQVLTVDIVEPTVRSEPIVIAAPEPHLTAPEHNALHVPLINTEPTVTTPEHDASRVLSPMESTEPNAIGASEQDLPIEADVPPTESAEPNAIGASEQDLPIEADVPPTESTELNAIAAPEQDLPIEADADEAFETDSALGEELSDTTSLTSSIINYKYENGRRYHAYKEGSYLLPNDEREQERLDLGHHLFLLLHDGKLIEFPLENPKRILDVGCGTGIWAITMADEFPEAEVIGIDLSPIQPGWVPPNCQFQVDDCEADWTFPPDQLFDLIYMGVLSGSISNWPRLIAQAYRQMAPGGYIVLYDIEGGYNCDDGTLRPDSSLVIHHNLCHKAFEILGKPLGAGHQHAASIAEAGFENIHDLVQILPSSDWPEDPKLKEIGKIMSIIIQESNDSYSTAILHRVFGWDIARAQVLLAGTRAELKKGDQHIYLKSHYVYGQKPLN